jgi:hypothetical protein
MEIPFKSGIQSFFLYALIGASTLGLMLSAGCVAPSAVEQADAATYVRGDLATSLPRDFNVVLEATHRAIKKLGFTEISVQNEPLSAVVVARATGGRKIELSISGAGKGLTNIKIRVDLFGDEQFSRSVLDGIKAEM